MFKSSLLVVPFLLLNCVNDVVPACGCGSKNDVYINEAQGRVVNLVGPPGFSSSAPDDFIIEVQFENVWYELRPCDSTIFDSKYHFHNLNVVVSGYTKVKCPNSFVDWVGPITRFDIASIRKF